jgi:hypothetical protein
LPGKVGKLGAHVYTVGVRRAARPAGKTAGYSPVPQIGGLKEKNKAPGFAASGKERGGKKAATYKGKTKTT